jgi:hypothetical protein
MAGPGRIVAAINTAYPKVRPDLWFGMDGPECYDANLLNEPFPKYLRGGYQTRRHMGVELQDFHATFFMDCEKADVDQIFVRRNHDIRFCWPNHTLGMALHGLVWMGAKDIRLVGCDMGGKRDYWDNRTLTTTQRAHNNRLYGEQLVYLKRFHAAGNACGINLSSCTKNSPINKFLPYTDLDKSLASIPTCSKKTLLHATEALNQKQLTVACVLKSGGCYTAEYVARLRDGVMKSLPESRFVCLTDMDVECDKIPLEHNWRGWFSKLELFKHFIGRTLYLDLDTVVGGSLSAINDVNPTFAMINDFLYPDMLASGVMMWSGDHRRLYEVFAKNADGNAAAYSPSTFNAAAWGDQAFIRDHLGFKAESIQAMLPPNFIASYKVHTWAVRRKASLICYHGTPKPHETNWAI